MKVGKVTGTVVASQQHAFYQGRKQLIVRWTRPDGSYDGDGYVIAVDLVGAGIGQTVLVEDEGNSARQLLECGSDGPIRSVIIGIVDSVNT